MEPMKPIIKQQTRILSPNEYRAIRGQLNREHRLLFDGLIFSGMRGTEFEMFMTHLDWFDARRQCISLPTSAILKVKTKFKERDVLLSDMGSGQLRISHMQLRKINLKDLVGRHGGRI